MAENRRCLSRFGELQLPEKHYCWKGSRVVTGFVFHESRDLRRESTWLLHRHFCVEELKRALDECFSDVFNVLFNGTKKSKISLRMSPSRAHPQLSFCRR